MTTNELLAMTDNEIGTHASGGYGAKKRNEFYAAIRRALLAAATVEPVKQPHAG
jgi:hypothetical protein